MEEERPFHRALDDAYYTGRILSVLDMETLEPMCRWIITDFPGIRLRNTGCIFLNTPSMCPENLTQGRYHKDKDITDMKCVKCSRMLRKKIQMVSLWTEILFLPGRMPGAWGCEGKIRVKKSEDDRFYAVKTAKMADAQDVELLAQKKEDSRKAQCQGPSQGGL